MSEAEVAERFKRFAEREAAPSSPLYARLAHAVADDAGLARFVARLSDRQPNLLFAAVQCLTGPGRMPRDHAALRAFVARHGDEVAALVATRRVQTNEVARCTALLPALPPGPLALLEVGASAGLALLLDRFAYDYGSARVGESDAVVKLRCRVAGPVPVPAALPLVVWRRGVDIAPVDVFDGDAVRWLAACVWADQPQRRERLEAAVRLARSDPPRVEQGDLVEALPRLAAEAPQDAGLVVFHAGVLPYLPQERRAAFVAALAGVSRQRPVTWVSNEAPGVVFEEPEAAGGGSGLRFVLGRSRFAGGSRHDQVLALADPHGASLEWLEPGRARTSAAV